MVDGNGEKKIRWLLVRLPLRKVKEGGTGGRQRQERHKHQKKGGLPGLSLLLPPSGFRIPGKEEERREGRVTTHSPPLLTRKIRKEGKEKCSVLSAHWMRCFG